MNLQCEMDEIITQALADRDKNIGGEDMITIEGEDSDTDGSSSYNIDDRFVTTQRGNSHQGDTSTKDNRPVITTRLGRESRRAKYDHKFYTFVQQHNSGFVCYRDKRGDTTILISPETLIPLMQMRYGLGDYGKDKLYLCQHSFSFAEVIGQAMTQFSLKQALKKFLEATEQAVYNEMKQLHDKNVIKAVPWQNLSKQEKLYAPKYLIFIKQKKVRLY